MHKFNFNFFIILGISFIFYNRINIFATPLGNSNLQMQVVNSNVEKDEDELFMTANHRIEIFFDETYENSKVLNDLLEWSNQVMAEGNVNVRFHNVFQEERRDYLNKLLTFFNLDSHQSNQSYMIIDNQILVQQILTYSQSRIELLIEELINSNTLDSEFITLKTNMIPNLYFSNAENKVAPLFQNVPFITELPTLSMIPINQYGLVDDLRWELAPKRVELFLDDTDQNAQTFIEEILNPMIDSLTNIDAVVRIYNINHENIIAYLTEILEFYGLTLPESDIFPLTIVNNQFLIPTLEKLKYKEYNHLVFSLLDDESTDLTLNEGIHVYEVLDEYKLTASRMYFSDGLAKKTHVASQMNEEIEHDVIPNPINFEEVTVEVFNDDLEELQLSVGKQKLLTISAIILLLSLPSLGYVLYKYKRLS